MSLRALSLGGRVGIGAAVALACAAAIVLAAGHDRDHRAATSTDSWAALRPSILERTEVGAARLGDRIYVVGGFISTGGTTGALERYDISADRWQRLRSLPIAVNHPGVTALDGRVYLLGGNLGVVDGRERKSRRLYRYSPGRNRWARLPDAPTARGALGLVAIDGKLYAAGGYDETRLAAAHAGDLRPRPPALDHGTGHAHRPQPRGGRRPRRRPGGHRRPSRRRQGRDDNRRALRPRHAGAGRRCPRSERRAAGTRPSSAAAG